MSKDQFARVTFTAGTAPPALILERASAAKTPFSWRLQGSDARTLEGAMGASAPGDGELTPVQVVKVCVSLWDFFNERDDHPLNEQALDLRLSLLECFNIEEV